MGIIVLLISISLAIAVFFLLVFFWSIKSGQYDDTYTPSVRMLFEDKKRKGKPDKKSKNKTEGSPSSLKKLD